MGNWKENIELINDTVRKIPEIKPRTAKNLLHLLLLFNSFEETPNARYKFCDNYSLELKYYEQIFIYFRDRYVTDNKINSNFEGLFKKEFRPGNNINSEESLESKIKKHLLNENVSNKDKLFTCIEIAYRFRNNIFHGTKAIFQLDDYNECYDKIIELFSNILEYSQKIIIRNRNTPY